MTQRIAITLLSLSATAFVGLAIHEGYTPDAVIPVPGDVPTIGFGTTEGVKLGDKINVPTALRKSLKDIKTVENTLKNCLTVPLHQYEYDVYVTFSYNIGPTKFCNSTLAKKLNKGDYKGACEEILKFVYFKKKDCRVKANKCGGLPDRRQDEYKQCIGQ